MYEDHKLDENSPTILQSYPKLVENINIQLKPHQLAMIQKCIDIESFNISQYGIMNDKPSTGKSYVILSIILYYKLLANQQTENQTPQTHPNCNLLVIPLNIYNQWIQYVTNFTDNLLKLKTINSYADLICLHNKTDFDELISHDIIITTPEFYNQLADFFQINSDKIFAHIFFDEIDSISSVLYKKINSNFYWFVSATLNITDTGVFEIPTNFMTVITCQCKDSFIDVNLAIDPPMTYNIVCYNEYIDKILKGILTEDEIQLMNAYDYSRLRRKFNKSIVGNDNEALTEIIKEKIDTIEFNKLQLEDIEKSLEKETSQQISQLINQPNKKIEELTELKNTITQQLNQTIEKVDLIKDRIKTNNFCPCCYINLYEVDEKVVSPCCNNVACSDCAKNWFETMGKTHCIYCNKPEVTLAEHIVIKKISENNCIVCNAELMENTSYSATCCDKSVCHKCIDEWYNQLLKTECLLCKNRDTTFYNFMTKREHEHKIENIKNGFKYIQKTKIKFLEYFLKSKVLPKNTTSKIIIFSDNLNTFTEIKKLLAMYRIYSIELDGGDSTLIQKQIASFIYSDIRILMCNSTLYGCGMNITCATDILFFHKMNEDMEKQVIGRAQRIGRKTRLNVWYLMNENEINELSEEQLKKIEMAAKMGDSNIKKAGTTILNERQQTNKPIKVKKSKKSVINTTGGAGIIHENYSLFQQNLYENDTSINNYNVMSGFGGFGGFGDISNFGESLLTTNNSHNLANMANIGDINFDGYDEDEQGMYDTHLSLGTDTNNMLENHDEEHKTTNNSINKDYHSDDDEIF